MHERVVQLSVVKEESSLCSAGLLESDIGGLCVAGGLQRDGGDLATMRKFN